MIGADQGRSTGTVAIGFPDRIDRNRQHPRQLFPDFGFPGSRRIVGALLAGMGVLVAAGSVRRWRQVQQAMRRGTGLPPTLMPLLLGSGLVVLTVVVLVLLPTSR